MNSLGAAATGVAFAGAGVFLLTEGVTAAGVGCLILGGMGLVAAVAVRKSNGGRGTGLARVLMILGLGLGLVLLIAAPASDNPMPRAPDDPLGVRILGGLITVLCAGGLIAALRRKSRGA